MDLTGSVNCVACKTLKLEHDTHVSEMNIEFVFLGVIVSFRLDPNTTFYYYLNVLMFKTIQL
jgi:hypothetical protein